MGPIKLSLSCLNIWNKLRWAVFVKKIKKIIGLINNYINKIIIKYYYTIMLWLFIIIYYCLNVGFYGRSVGKWNGDAQYGDNVVGVDPWCNKRSESWLFETVIQ